MLSLHGTIARVTTEIVSRAQITQLPDRANYKRYLGMDHFKVLLLTNDRVCV